MVIRGNLKITQVTISPLKHVKQKFMCGKYNIMNNHKMMLYKMTLYKTALGSEKNEKRMRNVRYVNV